MNNVDDWWVKIFKKDLIYIYIYDKVIFVLNPYSLNFSFIKINAYNIINVYSKVK